MQSVRNNLVWVLDSDAANLNAISRVGQQAGFQVRNFPEFHYFSSEFNEQLSIACAAGNASCILMNVRTLGRIDLLALPKELKDIPKVFIGATHVSCELERLARVGMFDFIAQPFTLQRLQDVLNRAFAHHTDLLSNTHKIKRRFELLSKREYQVGALVVQGLTNQAIAEQLDISIKTVKAHRAKVMLKTQSDTLVELLRNYDSHARMLDEKCVAGLKQVKATSPQS